jgi:RNA polymerase sigma-70 factor (ECF subfamily)
MGLGGDELQPVDMTELRAVFDAGLAAVYPYLYRRCGGDQALAEDLTQDTFLTAVARVRAGKVDRLSVPWLLTVARSRMIDHFRREARERRKLRLAWSSAPSVAAAEPELAGSEERTLRAWRSVAPMQRAALALHYLDCLSVAQVAAALDRSVHATESLLARGRQRFQLTYLERGDD